MIDNVLIRSRILLISYNKKIIESGNICNLPSNIDLNISYAFGLLRFSVVENGLGKFH